MTADLELDMFLTSYSYETFKITSKSEAVEGVDDDVRMSDRLPGPVIRRVVAARSLPLDHHHAAISAPPLPVSPPPSLISPITP
ncbi:hypothetical protein K525DRAFT_275223 [Schizophyllum commune Loenen D]|nr:hypothetical protein K525DRAFT_275223 [Schizophyllum commune Loenen D]